MLTGVRGRIERWRPSWAAMPYLCIRPRGVPGGRDRLRRRGGAPHHGRREQPDPARRGCLTCGGAIRTGSTRRTGRSWYGAPSRATRWRWRSSASSSTAWPSPASLGFGLLGSEVCAPACRVLISRRAVALHRRIALPTRPMVGVVGTTPANFAITTAHRACTGQHGPQRRHHRLTVYLPVFRPGRCWHRDVHASMGDGEVTGTALEAPATVHARITLIKGKRWASPGSTGPTNGTPG